MIAVLRIAVLLAPSSSLHLSMIHQIRRKTENISVKNRWGARPSCPDKKHKEKKKEMVGSGSLPCSQVVWTPTTARKRQEWEDELQNARLRLEVKGNTLLSS